MSKRKLDPKETKGKVRQPPSLPSLQRLVPRLDWKAYFLEFCRVHGEPIPHDGRLLFPDGWTYSATDYEGPEYPPPKDFKELDELVLRYWVIRRSTLSRLILKLQHEKSVLEKVMIGRSVPLQQVTFVQEEDRRRRAYKPLDLSALCQQIEWIETDLRECNQRLKEIEAHYKKESA